MKDETGYYVDTFYLVYHAGDLILWGGGEPKYDGLKYDVGGIW